MRNGSNGILAFDGGGIRVSSDAVAGDRVRGCCASTIALAPVMSMCRAPAVLAKGSATRSMRVVSNIVPRPFCHGKLCRRNSSVSANTLSRTRRHLLVSVPSSHRILIERPDQGVDDLGDR